MVPEDTPDRQVLQKILERLKIDGWSGETAMWIFLDAEERVKVRLPIGPVPPGMGRLQMREELQRENMGIVVEGRLPEPWGKPRNTGIEFSVRNIEEAKKAVFKSMRWNGHLRRAEMVTGGKEYTPARTLGYNRSPRPQGPWNNNWRTPGGNTGGAGGAGACRGRSNVQCFNCQGYGHTKDVYSSAARKALGRIDRMKSGKGKGKAERKIDKERFELVEGKRRITEVEKSRPPTPGPTPKETEKAETQASGGIEYRWEPTPHTHANKKAKVGG